MDTQKRFWLTCPACQKKFGVKPSAVFKYLNRVIEEMKQEMLEHGKKLGIKVTPEPPDNLPIAEE
jgi:hypothetical protein